MLSAALRLLSNGWVAYGVRHWLTRLTRSRFGTGLACGSMVLPFYLYLVFALYERKNQIQKEGKVPLRKPRVEHHVSPVIEG
jgi:hypothetical protein